jgi:RNA polymerase sigma-70 factor (ECF subfamily)
MTQTTTTNETLDALTSRRREFLRFVESRVSTRSAAEDIIQSAYLRAFVQLHNLRDNESAVAWFYRILRNAVIDYYRHRGVEDRTLQQWSEDLSEPTIPHPPTEQAICACINSVLAAMKPNYREVLRQVDLGNQTLEAYAQSANITPGNAAVRAHRARLALRKQLLLTCKSCAKHACLDCTCAA